MGVEANVRDQQVVETFEQLRARNSEVSAPANVSLSVDAPKDRLATRGIGIDQQHLFDHHASAYPRRTILAVRRPTHPPRGSLEPLQVTYQHHGKQCAKST